MNEETHGFLWLLRLPIFCFPHRAPRDPIVPQGKLWLLSCIIFLRASSWGLEGRFNPVLLLEVEGSVSRPQAGGVNPLLDLSRRGAGKEAKWLKSK